MVSSRVIFAIEPHVGLGPLQFGMSRQDVYAILGAPNWCRGPGEFSSMTSERFEAHCCFVEFDLGGQCCAAELYPDACVVLDGVNLMAMTYKNLVAYLRSRGATVVEEDDGFRCDDLGIACYASEADEPDVPDARIESVLVYRHGYHDELDKLLAKMSHKSNN